MKQQKVSPFQQTLISLPLEGKPRLIPATFTHFSLPLDDSRGGGPLAVVGIKIKIGLNKSFDEY